MHDLSIIIVSYNTIGLTKKCIKSILEDQKNRNVQIVVVDNKSTDGSVKMLRGLWRKHKNISLIENDKNLGFAKGVNIGIGKSDRKYILLLNSDTVVEKGSISKLYKFAQNTSDAGAVVAQLVNEDGTVQPSCFNFQTIINAAKEYLFGIENSYKKFFPSRKSPVSVDCAVMAVFLITPRALDKVGLLDERYFMYYEDHEYCRRIAKAGLKVYYLPSAKVLHYHGESGKGLKEQKDQWRRLIPSSKIYHGILKHYIINLIIKVGQKLNNE
jgi:GT2 family glycosyltransferase